MGSRTMFRRSFIPAALALLTGIMFGASAAIAAEPIKIGFSMFPAGPDAVREFSRGYFEIAKEQKLQTVAIAGADSDFAKKAADGARENATKMGFKIVYDRSYPPNTVDFAPIVRGIQASDPDFVYIASYPTETVGIARAANEIGLKTKLFGGGMVGLQYASIKTQLGELLNRIVDYDFYVPEPTVPFKGIEGFLARYQAKAPSIGADLLGYFIPSRSAPIDESRRPHPSTAVALQYRNPSSACKQQ